MLEEIQGQNSYVCSSYAANSIYPSAPPIVVKENNIKKNNGVVSFGIGRLDSNGLVVPSTETSVSRIHLDVIVNIQTGEVTIIDKGSTVGSRKLLPEVEELNANQPLALKLQESWKIHLGGPLPPRGAFLSSKGNGSLELESDEASNVAVIKFDLPQEEASAQVKTTASKTSLLAALLNKFKK
ncbi:MAG: FHA domain-containing protein [Candidatus Melainabacteria bacterium]|nr:FHA domain-containing protein [Candidatus Melainabacteria bacterium]